MKHLKLFEAFESEKLSKTIKFIKDKSEFKTILGKIGAKLDFPISEFEDSMFEYLPYHGALKKDVTEIKLDEFGKPKIQLIKFWFTKDGDFVKLTGSDGDNSNNQKFSRRIEDYELVKDLIIDEVKNLESGQIVLFAPKDDDNIAVVGYIWRFGRKVWVLQDKYDGNCPGNLSSENRKEIAEYSWIIDSDSDFREMKLLKQRVDKKVVSNKELSLYYWELKKEETLDADFAIILDINKLEESRPKSLSGIRSEREDKKSGAFLSNEKIKQINIERFLKKLVDKFDFENSFDSLSKVVTRSLGQKYALFFITRRRNLSNLEEVVSLLYNFVKNPSDSIKNKILEILRGMYSYHEKSRELTTIIDDIRKNERDNPEYLRVLESCLGISDLLYQKISNQKIENISDIEVLMEKIYLFQRFLDNSRLPHIRGIRSVAWGLENGSKSILYDLEWCVDRGEEFFETVKGVERAIEKIF